MTKPWDNEPTPFKDRLVDEHGDFFISRNTVANLERRLRHAEWLLAESWGDREIDETLHGDVMRHLEAARLEDGR